MLIYDPIVELPPDLQLLSFEPMSRPTWHLPRNVYDPIRRISNGYGVKVAVLDTGYYKHPTLPTAIATRSFINGESVVDRNAHGTHCSGTVLSRDPNIGLAPAAELIIGKVLSNAGSGSSSGIAAGINWAVDQGADIINLSLGGGSSYAPTNQAIQRAVSRGVIVCIAAGNSGFNGSTNTIGFPARAGDGICVAALNERFQPATFSSGGVQMIIAAPGQNILSCANSGDNYRLMSGTSMACPFVAGCYALIVSQMRRLGQPSWTSTQAVNAFVRANAKDLLTPGHDHRTGFGMYDMTSVMTTLAKDELIYV